MMNLNRNLTILLASACLAISNGSANAQVRILPLGDSTTSSMAPYSSYRYWLWQSLVNAGFDVDFVGTQWGVVGGTPDKTDFDQHHEGHPGWTTQDALFEIDSIANATHPDIVLLDLGSNDIIDGVPLETVMNNLSEIISRLRAVNPNVVILLAQPTPFEGPNKRTMSKLKGAISKVAKHEKSRQSPVIKVNLFGGFKVPKDTFDGAHPNELGEMKIARKYFKALRKQLRKM